MPKPSRAVVTSVGASLINRCVTRDDSDMSSNVPEETMNEIDSSERPVMHLSISCPTPHPGGVGEYRGFDNYRCQIPHPWGKIGCQIPTISPTPLVGDLTTPWILVKQPGLHLQLAKL